MLITHDYQGPCYEQSQIDGLLAPDDQIDQVIVDTQTWQLPDLTPYSAVVFCVRFRDLMQQDQLSWNGYSGLKVLLDQDSFMDFVGWHGRSPYEGMWIRTFQRLGFDLLLCTGQRSVEHFRVRGVPAELLYKGYDERYFYPLGVERDGICHYGNPYTARRNMLRVVRRAGVVVNEVRAPYVRLNEDLNSSTSVIICNMTSEIPFGRIGASIEYRFPGSLMRLQKSPEPMIKNFEAMAAGCCVFADVTPDDSALGFEDGQTCVIYSDFDDLVDRIRHYQSRPDLLGEIGARGSQLVRERHTWVDRGHELRLILANA